MKEHDIEKNGIISYLEFKYIFLDVSDQQYEVDKANNNISLPKSLTKQWANDEFEYSLQ